ncbi:hypothetical protein ACLI4Z_08140 [Natrialbaceae archaeon A-arb3/5]
MDTVSTILGSVRRPGRESNRGRRSDEDDEADAAVSRAPSVDSTDEAGELLRSIGVVESSHGEPVLEPTFGAAWRTRIEQIRERKSRLDVLAEQLGLGTDQVALEVAPDGFAVTHGRDRVGCWPSDGAFLADLAAVSVLSETNPDWRALDADDRRLALSALRLFLERCPNCDGSITGSGAVSETTDRRTAIESSDTGAHRSVACDRCGSVLFRESDE